MLTSQDYQLLQKIDAGDVFWSRREGGSEAYQIYRSRTHELVAEGYVYEFSKNSCCMREYGLTQKGAEAVAKWLKNSM